MGETSLQGLSDEAQDLLKRARQLSPADRAQLVGGILESLDEPDPAVDDAWRAEVERRADGMDDGTRTATPWSQARKTLGL